MSTTRSTIFRLILNVIHLCAWLKSLFTLFKQWIAGILNHSGSKVLIQKDANRLKKVPLHLALVVAEEDIHYVDLACIIWWSFAFGIQYVSVFDKKGKIKESISKLRHSIQTHCYSSDDYPVNIVCLGNTITPSLPSGVMLLVLSNNDSFQTLVEVAQSLCEEAKSSIAALPNHPSCIDSRMIFSHFAPDPDLAVICGQTKALGGFPPWCTPLTELMWLPTHRKPKYFDFYCILQKFSTSQQRHGK